MAHKLLLTATAVPTAPRNTPNISRSKMPSRLAWIECKGTLIRCGNRLNVGERSSYLHEEFQPRTMWSLSNAFTPAFKKLDPVLQFNTTAKFAEFLEPRFSE